MVCKKCGKLIGENSSYCMFCHAPTDSDMDFNIELDVLEDEELYQALQREENIPEPQNTQVITEDVPEVSLKNKRIIISLVTIVSVFVIGFIGYFYQNSYAYTVSKANKVYLSGDYETSYLLYERALEKQPEGVDALIGAGNCYSQMGDYQAAKTELTKALTIEESNTKAYTSLLDVYVKSEDAEGLLNADKLATTDEMKEILKNSVVEMPQIIATDMAENGYDLLVEIKTQEDIDVFYTTDDKDITKGEGKLYDGPFTLKEGKYTIKAVAYKNESYSLVAEVPVTVTYEKPMLPRANPMGGSFTELTKVSLTSNMEDAIIYYTWDGSSPTVHSNKYTEPMDIIPGNNVLSAIAVAKNGKQSEVLKCNFIYDIEGKEGTNDSVPFVPDIEEDEKSERSRP